MPWRQCNFTSWLNHHQRFPCTHWAHTMAVKNPWQGERIYLRCGYNFQGFIIQGDANHFPEIINNMSVRIKLLNLISLLETFLLQFETMALGEGFMVWLYVWVFPSKDNKMQNPDTLRLVHILAYHEIGLYRRP